MSRRAFAFAVLLSVLTWSGHAQAPIKLACAEGSASEALIPLVRAIYEELGIPLIIDLLPAKRGLVSANQGIYDGDVGRVVGSLTGYDQLFFTTEPIFSLNLVPWIKKGRTIKLEVPEDLKSYGVAYVRGLNLAESFCSMAGIVAEVLSDFEAATRMLEAGRVDVVLSTYPAPCVKLAEVAESRKLTLASAYSYHVLNKKHAELAKRFDAVLKAMKADGRYDMLVGRK